MNSVRAFVCVVWVLCGGVATAAPQAEHREGNMAAMREAAKAVRVAVAALGVAPVRAAAVPSEAADLPAVPALAAQAVPRTGLLAPVVSRLDNGAELTAYSYVFAWNEDVPLLFPEIAARRAAPDSYFGWQERRIAAACASNDLQTAGDLVRQYVYQWDNIYKVHPR